MSFVAELIRKAIAVAIALAMSGGLVDATRAMMTNATDAQTHGLVSLGRLNRMLLSGGNRSFDRNHDRKKSLPK